MYGKERAYAAINLDNIKKNVSSIKKSIKNNTGIIAVIKADGYGHGAARIARELYDEPSIWGYAVATIDEAMELRFADIHKPILILGYSFPSAFESIVLNDIRSAVFDFDTAYDLNEVAKSLGKKAIIHLKVDTGMNRIGMQPISENVAMIKKIMNLSNIIVEGIFTHFARADEADKTNVNKQHKCFDDFLGELKKCGINIPMAHCSNSAAIIDMKNANYNLVRAGIILYGLWPSDEVDKNSIKLYPAMEIKSTIVHVKKVSAGTEISYGGIYTTSTTEKIATVSIGYADGYPRILSNKGYVLVRGKKAPIVGRVCMDQFMIDVSHIPGAARGDEVTIVGADGDDVITMDDFAKLSGRINYEAVCDIGKRVPRVYFKNGHVAY